MKQHAFPAPLLLVLSLLLGSLLSTNVMAATYKWQDANGNTVYSQQPPASGPYETIQTKTSSGSKYSRPQSPPAPASAPASAPRSAAADDDSKVQAEIAKNQQLRKQNCEAARHNLELYTVYRRVKNDKGEIVRLDDDERARRLQEAKDGIKEFCD